MQTIQVTDIEGIDRLTVDRLTLDRLTLERLSAADAPAMAAHLKRLAEFDRYSRFFSAMSDEGIDRYVGGFDWSRMIATGLYQSDTLIGIAELGWEARAHMQDGAHSESGTPPVIAEMAVSVDNAYRHRGIAAWLVNETVRRGRKAGIRRMEASWIGGNDPIAKIMRRLEAQVWLNGSHWHGVAPLA